MLKRWVFVASAVVVVACAPPAATQGPGATQATSSGALPIATAPASSGTSGLSPTALSGRWSVIAENPRILIATGEAAGSAVVIKGREFEIIKRVGSGLGFADGGRIEFVRDFELTCTSTSCPIAQTNYEIVIDGGAYVLVRKGTDVRYGTLGICGHPPIPGDGVVTVESQVVVQGVQVPAVVRFAGGHSGGSSESACARYGYLVAWDIVATRQP